MYSSRTLAVASGRLACVLASLLLGGCAATYDPGQALMNRGDYGAAVDVFFAAEAENPYDPAIKRRLGVALLRSGDAERSSAKLEEARALEPKEPSTYLFLGDARDRRGDLTGAIEAYAEYLRLGGKGGKAVRGKIDRLSSDLVRRQIGELLSREAEMMDRPAENTVAVADFALTTGEAELGPLAKGLAAIVITDLRKVERFRVLERERLGVLLRELDLADRSSSEDATPGASGADRSSSEEPAVPEPAASADDTVSPAGAPPRDYPDPATPQPRGVDERSAPRIGRLLSVRHFVQGYYGSSGAERIQLNANVVEITGTLAEVGSPVEGPVRDVLYLEKGLVFQILRALGVEPTPEERKAIDELATRSFDAFVAYSRGLVHRDAGRMTEAAAAFQEAVSADPQFVEAAEKLEEATWTESDLTALEDQAVRELSDGPPPVDDGRFLIDVAVNVGGGPPPDAPQSAGTPDGPSDAGPGWVGPSDPEVFGGADRITFPLPPAGGSR